MKNKIFSLFSTIAQPVQQRKNHPIAFLFLIFVLFVYGKKLVFNVDFNHRINRTATDLTCLITILSSLPLLFWTLSIT